MRGTVTSRVVFFCFADLNALRACIQHPDMQVAEQLSGMDLSSMGSDLLPRNKPRKMSDIKRQVQQLIKKFVLNPPRFHHTPLNIDRQIFLASSRIPKSWTNCRAGATLTSGSSTPTTRQQITSLRASSEGLLLFVDLEFCTDAFGIVFPAPSRSMRRATASRRLRCKMRPTLGLSEACRLATTGAQLLSWPVA